MKKILTFIALNNLAYNISLKICKLRIINSKNILTVEYLKSKGFEFDGHYWVNPNIKERDKIWITLEEYWFRVYHGKNKTFIALESKLEWFDIYYSLLSDK